VNIGGRKDIFIYTVKSDKEVEKIYVFIRVKSDKEVETIYLFIRGEKPSWNVQTICNLIKKKKGVPSAFNVHLSSSRINTYIFSTSLSDLTV
jgi:hypothetical protein